MTCACGATDHRPHDHDCLGALCHACVVPLTIPHSLPFALCADHEPLRPALLDIWGPLVSA